MPIKKTKRPNRKKLVAQRQIYYSHRRWAQTRTWIHEEGAFEDVFPSQTCLFCYTSFMYDFNQKFFIRKRFCGPCRESIPYKQWCLLNKFFKVLQEALNKETAEPIHDGAVLQFVNGVYQCMRFKKSREYFVDTINSTIPLSNLGSPMELSELMEQYDALVNPKPKRREVKRKKRLLQRR
jgi:hypothetical protein